MHRWKRELECGEIITKKGDKEIKMYGISGAGNLIRRGCLTRAT